MVERCLGRNRDGSPCSAQPRPGGYCLWHDPGLAAARAGWRCKGGEGKSTANRAAKRLPKDLRDVRDALLRALRDVEGGGLAAPQANAMAALARAVVAVHQVAELEARVAALEQAADWGPGGRTA